MSFTWKKFGLFLKKLFWIHFTQKKPPTPPVKYTK